MSKIATKSTSHVSKFGLIETLVIIFNAHYECKGAYKTCTGSTSTVQP